VRGLTVANEFSKPDDFKKRVITVSVTEQQSDALNRLKARTNTITDSAIIKKALEHYIDNVSPEPTDSRNNKEEK